MIVVSLVITAKTPKVLRENLLVHCVARASGSTIASRADPEYVRYVMLLR